MNKESSDFLLAFKGSKKGLINPFTGKLFPSGSYYPGQMDSYGEFLVISAKKLSKPAGNVAILGILFPDFHNVPEVIIRPEFSDFDDGNLESCAYRGGSWEGAVKAYRRISGSKISNRVAKERCLDFGIKDFHI